jgi:hypothetical protein
LCDKLQSLFLGRPISIQFRDCNVKQELMDLYEENEPWSPYIDPKIQSSLNDVSEIRVSTATHSVSTFQELCSLAKIMTSIINQIYCVRIAPASATSKLAAINDTLDTWYTNLPPQLIYEPWKLAVTTRLSVPQTSSFF